MKEYDNNMKGSLWKRTAKSGLEYISGECTIDNVEYGVSMFINEKKNEKQPDYNIKFELKDTNRINEMHTTTKTKNDINVYEDFGKSIVIEDDDLPF